LIKNSEAHLTQVAFLCNDFDGMIVTEVISRQASMWIFPLASGQKAFISETKSLLKFQFQKKYRVVLLVSACSLA
jgi:hypothetical protein